MSWNPGVRAVPVVTPTQPLSGKVASRQREMEGAAAAAVVMALAQRSLRNKRRPSGRMNGQASAWVVNGRIEMVNRWPR